MLQNVSQQEVAHYHCYKKIDGVKNGPAQSLLNEKGYLKDKYTVCYAFVHLNCLHSMPYVYGRAANASAAVPAGLMLPP